MPIRPVLDPRTPSIPTTPTPDPAATTSTPVPSSPAPPSAATTPNALPQVDLYEKAPGVSFTNQLLGLDLNADGQLSKDELGAGLDTLRKLSRDGKEQDGVERSVLRHLLKAHRKADADTPPVTYQIENGTLQLHIQRGRRSEDLAFAHEATTPALNTEVLMNGIDAQVVHGTDPGDFYCEHMFFSTQMESTKPGSSVMSNPSGEKLVGFLHVPSDNYTGQFTPSGYTQEERHHGTRQVIGAALRGYFDAISPQVTEGPVRMLVSGYEQFMSVRNNPTGEFVSHRENLDASMRHAFGDALLQPTGEALPHNGPDNAQTYRYQIRDANTGRIRDIDVTLARFPVDDTAISPDSSASVQRVMASALPHGVISMGVAGRGSYRAEHRADSGGLQRLADNATHVEDASAHVQLRDNFALARAIQSGAQIITQ